MSIELKVSFAGNRKVDVQIGDVIVHTDQPVKDGGEGTAPSPSQLFLASIAACAGYFALVFCQKRKLSTTGMALSMECAIEEKSKQITLVTLHLVLPEGFPDKYREAIKRAVDACYVKKHIVDPPQFELVLT